MGKIIESGNYCVYVHTSPSGKMYVGQTGKHKPEYRWGKDGAGYLYKYEESGNYKQPAFARAIQKYGWNNFEHEIVASNLTKDEADNFEKLLIEKLDTTNPKYGYNSKEGGSHGCLSEDVRIKISESLRGEGHPMYGKHHSKETKRKISETHKANAKKIMQYDLQGNLVKIWDCMCDAGVGVGVSKHAIWRCCNRENKTSAGFIWRYCEDVEKIV